MKKATTKRLSLSRETIANLQTKVLGQAAGGSGIISSDNIECTFTQLGFETTCFC